MTQPPDKAHDAFRTIREVADWLAVPTHVLRFWESKFDAIAPVKGAGGRRYYRPEDMRLLGGIKVLLHDRGLTIRGVAQRIESEGVDDVRALSPDPAAAGADEGAARPQAAPARPRAAAGTPQPAIRREGGGEDDGMEEALQPNDDPMPSQPVDTPAPPQPEDGAFREPRLPRQPVDDDGARTASAPAPRDGSGAEGHPVATGRGASASAAPGRLSFGRGAAEGADAPQDAASRDARASAPDAAVRAVPHPVPSPDAPRFGAAPRGAGRTKAAPEPSGSPRGSPAPSPAPAARGGSAAPAGDGGRTVQKRRLRRIVHRLRTLIADLEEDLARWPAP